MKSRNIDLYFRLLFVFLGTLAAILSLKTYVSDSEFWAITASRQLGEAGASASIYMKFLFYGLLRPIYALPLDNIAHVLVARLEFAAVGAITAYVFYRVARLAMEDEFAGLVLTLILVTSTYFLSQSFRVRSDNLSSLLMLLALWAALIWNARKGERWGVYASIIFSINTLLLVATPKSFYFLIIGALFTSTLSFERLEKRQKALAVGCAYLAPPFLLLSLIQLAQLVPAFRWIDRAAIVAVEYFTDSFDGLAGQHTYFSSEDFAHLFSFLLQNPVHDLFFVASAYAWLSRRRSLREDKKDLAFFSLFATSLLLLIFHNQKLPFFIYAMLPLIVLGAGSAWRKWAHDLKSRDRSLMAVAAGLTAAAIGALWLTMSTIRLKSNEVQLVALREIQDLVSANSGVKYYDAVGLLPRSNVMFAFPSPDDRNNPVIMRVVENSRPELIFYVLRAMELEPRFGFYLSDFYVDLGAGTWARAVPPKLLKPLIHSERGDRCSLSKDSLRSVVENRFSGKIDRLRLVEVDSGGYVRDVVSDFSIDRSASWKCGELPLAIIRVEPLRPKVPLDLRYVFGFDVVGFDQPFL